MEYWIVAGIAAYVMGLSKGGMPIIAMLSVPLMSIFMDPAMAAGLLLPLYLIADVYAIYLFRKAYSVENLRHLIPGAIMGVLLGFFTVSSVPGVAIKFLVAMIGISFLIVLIRRRFDKTERAPKKASLVPGVFWGTVAGLTSYISHAGGPPFQAYVLPQRLDKMVFLGTTTIFFGLVNLMKVIPYIIAGQITWDSMGQAIWLAPMALAGAWSGAWVAHRLSERIFFILVEVALGVVSIKLFYEVLLAS